MLNTASTVGFNPDDIKNRLVDFFKEKHTRTVLEIVVAFDGYSYKHQIEPILSKIADFDHTPQTWTLKSSPSSTSSSSSNTLKHSLVSDQPEGSNIKKLRNNPGSDDEEELDDSDDEENNDDYENGVDEEQEETDENDNSDDENDEEVPPDEVEEIDEDNNIAMMNYVISNPSYQSCKHHQPFYDTNDDNDGQLKTWFCDIQIITKQYYSSQQNLLSRNSVSQQHIFMKRIICPLPKIIPLRTDFSHKSTIAAARSHIDSLAIDIHNQLVFMTEFITFRLIIFDLQKKEIKASVGPPTRKFSRILKICENDNSIYDLGSVKLTKHKYNVTKILAGCNENILQHIWTFDRNTVTDRPMRDLTIDIDDNQVSHCGSGVIFVACIDIILVLNGFDGNLLKIIRGFHHLERIELDGNRNLLVCEYYKNHTLVTRDGHVIMKIRRMTDYYVEFLLHDRSSNNMILIYTQKLYPEFDVIQILSPNGRVVLERKIDFCASGACLNMLTGELLLINPHSELNREGSNFNFIRTIEIFQ